MNLIKTLRLAVCLAVAMAFGITWPTPGPLHTPAIPALRWPRALSEHDSRRQLQQHIHQCER